MVFPCSLALFSFSTNIGKWASSAFSALICEEQHKSIQVQQHTMMMVRSDTRGRLWIIYVRLKTLCFERRKVLPFINLIKSNKKSLSNRKFYATYEWSPRDKTLRASKKREKHVHDRRSCWTLSCSVLVRLSWRSVRSSTRARLCLFISFLSQRVRVYRSLYCGVLFFVVLLQYLQIYLTPVLV